jgi:hypothetical protein
MVWLSVDKLKPEDKVNLAIGMTDVCVRVCADGIKDRYGTISEEEVAELVRERLTFGRRRVRGV